MSQESRSPRVSDGISCHCLLESDCDVLSQKVHLVGLYCIVVSKRRERARLVASRLTRLLAYARLKEFQGSLHQGRFAEIIPAVLQLLVSGLQVSNALQMIASGSEIIGRETFGLYLKFSIVGVSEISKQFDSVLLRHEKLHFEWLSLQAILWSKQLGEQSRPQI